MDELPAPLTPADCDLRDFPFMPLLVSRLRRSKAWLMAKRQPELGFYMINLWTAAWHDFPSGSIEDDDDVIADLAMCDPRHWPKVREKAMHGWIKCSDGRLYHPVVAEQACKSWDERKSYRDRMAKARAVKSQRHASNYDNPIIEPVAGDNIEPDTGAATEPITEPIIDAIIDAVTGPITALKGQGQGQGEKKEKAAAALIPSPRAQPPDQPAPTAENRYCGWENGKEIVGGYEWDYVWPAVLEAANIDPVRSLATDIPVRKWLRDGITPETFLPVLKRISARSREKPIQTLAFFDEPVREAARKVSA
jgi:uncharacterized protein DUF1376